MALAGDTDSLSGRGALKSTFCLVLDIQIPEEIRTLDLLPAELIHNLIKALDSPFQPEFICTIVVRIPSISGMAEPVCKTIIYSEVANIRPAGCKSTSELYNNLPKRKTSMV